MSSLTTSSDDEIGWRRCLVACLGALGVSALLLLGALILIDPYDSGRGWLGIDGVDDRDTHTATATLRASTQAANDSLPTGNYLADGGPYQSATNTTMNANAVAVTNGISGNSQPTPIIQPYLCVNFIIALEGIFPSRN